MYGDMIERSDNLVQETIRAMSCYNNGLGSLGVNIYLYLGLKRHLVIQIGKFSI